MIAELINDEAQVAKMKRWVARLRSTRIFRRMLVDAKPTLKDTVEISVTLTDGLTTIKTVPFSFHLPTMEFAVLYQRLEDEIVECVRALVRQKTAPELVFKGTSPVEVINAPTDGEEEIRF